VPPGRAEGWPEGGVEFTPEVELRLHQRSSRGATSRGGVLVGEGRLAMPEGRVGKD
jgi:hypothetical protein